MSGYKPYILLCLAAVFLLFPSLSASALLPRVTGSASLGYRDYEISQAGSKVEDADSFYQRYSLLSIMNGNLYNRRGGPYRLTLTYNHLQYLTDINGVEYSPFSSFFGWDGDLRLKMPHLHGLDLMLYSSSRRENRMYNVDMMVVGASSRDFVYDLGRSDTKRSGFKLKVGVNGGPYYYFYQDNYDLVETEGLHQDYSRLGMSVESGVNWVHIYRDEEAPGGIEKLTFILGNIGLPEKVTSTRDTYDYTSLYSTSREWYRLTNWLDLSADFLYSDEDNDVTDISTKRATVAVKGDTGQFSIGSYSVHERVDTDSQSTRSLSLPFWADYRLSPATVVYFNNNYSDSKAEDLATLSVRRSKALSDSLTLTSIPSKELFLETGYLLNKSDTDGEGRKSHSIYFDGYTRREDQFDYSLSYRYDTDMVDNATYDDRTSYSHFLNGTVTYRLAQKTRLRLSQSYLSAYQEDATPYDKYDQFTTSFYIDHFTHGGLHSYLDITRSSKLNEDGTEELRNRMDIILRKEINRRLQATFNLIYNNDQNDLSGRNEDSESLASKTIITYKMAGNLESATRLETVQTETSGRTSTSEFEFWETLKYTYNRKGFSKRRLLDIAGTAWYRKWESGSVRDDENRVGVIFNYYPAIMFSCGASYSSESDSEIVNRTLYADLRYPLLTLKGSYKQRVIEAGDQKEDLYSIDFTKRF